MRTTLAILALTSATIMVLSIGGCYSRVVGARGMGASRIPISEPSVGEATLSRPTLTKPTLTKRPPSN